MVVAVRFRAVYSAVVSLMGVVTPPAVASHPSTEPRLPVVVRLTLLTPVHTSALELTAPAIVGRAVVTLSTASRLAQLLCSLTATCPLTVPIFTFMTLLSAPATIDQSGGTDQE